MGDNGVRTVHTQSNIAVLIKPDRSYGGNGSERHLFTVTPYSMSANFADLQDGNCTAERKDDVSISLDANVASLLNEVIPTDENTAIRLSYISGWSPYKLGRHRANFIATYFNTKKVQNRIGEEVRSLEEQGWRGLYLEDPTEAIKLIEEIRKALGSQEDHAEVLKEKCQ